jgi:transketolase
MRDEWTKREAKADEATKALISGRDVKNIVTNAIVGAKNDFAADSAKRATRVWSQMVIERLVPVLPEIIGGSADLSGSNGTRTKHHVSVTPDNFAGNYMHYGVREHGMAAAMNGIALSGSFVPYGGTFLVFSDYCRASIRLSALMQQRVIYVLTHDSIGLGEDGPTHQPVEHLSALRVVPNLHVFRPADGIETAECWELALVISDTPSVLALSRQAVPNLRGKGDENLSAKGAYVLKATEGARDVTFLATGSEVGLAVEAAATLAKDGIKAAVVSMPSFELFRAQPEGYQNEVLGDAPRIAIEAGVAQSWYEWLRKSDVFIGMNGFGASAPASKLFEHFGITAAHAVTAARKAIGKNS